MSTYKSDDMQRDRLAYMLAQAIMGWRDAEAPSVAGIASGEVQVDIHIQSMVRELVKRVWIDNAAISQATEQAVLEAAGKVKMPGFVRDAVDAEFSKIKRDLDRVIREKIETQVNDVIHDIVNRHITPHLKAKAESIVKNIWSDGKTGK